MMRAYLVVCLGWLLAVGCSDGVLDWSGQSGIDGAVKATDCPVCGHDQLKDMGPDVADAGAWQADTPSVRVDRRSPRSEDARSESLDSAVVADATPGSLDSAVVADARLEDLDSTVIADARVVDTRGDSGLTVVASDNLNDEGRSCIRVKTAAATYLYDKKGAGFTSLIDQDGNDWISWRPGNGSGGEYRGIPNLGNCCHPGYDSATSQIVANQGDYAKIRSTGIGSDGKRFEVTWEFWPDHATLTVVEAPSSYYMLYEGTPGGKLGQEDFLVHAAGPSTRTKLMQGGELITADLPGPEWIYFEDSNLRRALLLVHHEDDRVGERYWTMNSEMTVFGFGRNGHGASMGLTAVPKRLSIALVEQVTFLEASGLAAALMR